MNAIVERAYADLEGLVACAGIYGNPEAAFEARVNHYGRYTKDAYVPARPVITRAVSGGGDNARRMAELIKSRIVAARPESRPEYTRRSSSGETYVVASHTRSVPFDIGQGRHNNPMDIMQAIAREMVANQRKAIKNWELAPNKASTVKRKGMGKPPMMNTGELYDSLEAWVDKWQK